MPEEVWAGARGLPWTGEAKEPIGHGAVLQAVIWTGVWRCKNNHGVMSSQGLDSQG
jgi:hypothetical protein